jgi:YidC/Oxa1 family membrane protein insertase
LAGVWQDLVQGFAALLSFLYRATGNYGVAIILLTALIRLLLWPLTQSQFRSMRRMQELQPQLQRLQERYKNDRERLQQETMRLWRENKVNPASGCLPLLVQLPFLYALYAMLRAFPFGARGGFLWVPSMGTADPYYVLPVLAAATTLWQTRISTVQAAQPNPSAQSMMWMMPLFILWVSLKMPAGLVIYWVVSNLFTVAQQYAQGRGTRPAAGGTAAARRGRA